MITKHLTTIGPPANQKYTQMRKPKAMTQHHFSLGITTTMNYQRYVHIVAKNTMTVVGCVIIWSVNVMFLKKLLIQKIKPTSHSGTTQISWFLPTTLLKTQP